MGLLDGMLGNVISNAIGGGTAVDPKAALIQGVLSMLLNQNGQSAGAGNLIGNMLGGQAGGALGNVLGGLLGGGQSQGGGLAGGLGGLFSAMAQNGLSEHAASWQGTGSNLPINANQLTQILGSLGGGAGAAILSQLAGHAGMKTDEAAGHLSELLPNIVDQLTPNGQITDASNLDLGSLIQQMLGKVG